MPKSITKKVIFEIFLCLLLITSVGMNFFQKSVLEDKNKVILNQNYINTKMWDISQALQIKMIKEHENTISLSQIVDLQADIIHAQNKDIARLLRELNAAPKL